MSFDTGVFPEKLKTGLIRPILKSGKQEVIDSNMWPVTNLEFLGKTIKWIVFKQLTNHLENNHLVTKSQSAYHANHSTETCLLEIRTDIFKAIDNKQVVCLVLLDQSAAFDLVNHTKPREWLQKRFNITGLAVNWISLYLHNRVQQVAIGDPNLDNVTSNPVTTNFGVPQGSVLGPILFTLFSSPLADICEENHLDAQFFADDKQMYIAFQPKQGTTAPEDSCIDTIAKCIQDTKIWMDFNLLKLNEEKTEFIILGNSQQLRKVCDPQLFLGEETITPVTKVRNLGYYMDQFIRNDHHINTISVQCFGLLKTFSPCDPTSIPKLAEPLSKH